MKKYKIGIWGQLGDGINKIADGQAVRTTIITNELKNKYGAENIFIVNTNNWKSKPIRFIFRTIKLNLICNKIIILPADNGFKVVVPLIDFFNCIFNKELYDIVIGGYLPTLLKNKPSYIRKLKKYKALFVQTPNLKKDLEAFGLSNIYMLSNLKRLNTVEEKDIAINMEKNVKVCTLSRITNDKGIDYAVEAVKKANAILGKEIVKLDIFGVVDANYQQHFNELLSNSTYINYGGILDYNKTVETLKHYFLLLFPTFYYGEGFPGNVVDAYNSGVPIVATDWLYNKDVIKHGKNGILVPVKDSDSLCNAILELYNDREKHFEYAINNVKEAEKYKPDVVLKELYSFLD